ncbi:hypothetical protein GGI04_000848 [Coemansia thaxteri]|nr:hypothetical protein GGI04_000848 [Coemansia thaxteri]
MFLGPGLTNSYGIFEEEYEKLYSDKSSNIGGSLSPAIGVGAAHLASVYLFTTIAGALCERLGMGLTTFIGTLLVGTGLFAAGFCTKAIGAGIGTIFIIVSTIPTSWFSKNQGFLIGVVHSGSGVGGLVLAPVSRYLIDKYGLSGAVKILGLILASGIAVASLGMATKPDELLDQEDEKDTDSMLSAGNSACEFSNDSLAKKRMSVRSFGVRNVRRIGLSSEQGALLVGVANGATIVGRITIGYIADLAGNINMFFVTHLLVTLSCVLLWFPAKSFMVMMLFACIFGLFAGSLTPMMPLCLVTLFGQNGLASNVGLLGIGIVLTTSVAPVVARLFYEKLGQNGAGYGTVALFCGGHIYFALVRVSIFVD